ncbi:hypothetical protein B296_00029082 [Ensete ventricosum]|uniref:Uncharacterized protein n=1 Tax=Ensete ventricosum TaxID=4639 RepID=A0A427A6D5_ENSVE|nr:hypothetical protein B296_00029082 [Ensete ventricosum]
MPRYQPTNPFRIEEEEDAAAAVAGDKEGEYREGEAGACPDEGCLNLEERRWERLSKVAEDEAVCSPATTSQEASAHFCDERGRGGSRSLGLTAFAAVVVGAAAAVTPFRGCGWVPVKQRIAALCRDLRGDSSSHVMLTCRTLGRHG